MRNYRLGGATAVLEVKRILRATRHLVEVLRECGETTTLNGVVVEFEELEDALEDYANVAVNPMAPASASADGLADVLRTIRLLRIEP